MALQLIPLGPPAFDSFTPLSQIGQSFFKNYDDSRKRKLEDDFAKSNADLTNAMSAPAQPAPQGGTLGSMGQTPNRSVPSFVTATGTPDKQKFVETIMPHALAASEATGVDPRIIIGQAAIETGWGKSAPGNNYFGIKSHGQAGGNTMATTEVVNGQPVRIRDSFRAYASPGDSVAGYADFLKSNPRYRAMMNAQGLDQQLQALQASGYATDPNYSAKVGSVARGIQIASAAPGMGYTPNTRPQALPMQGPPMPASFDEAVPGASQQPGASFAGMPAPQAPAPVQRPPMGLGGGMPQSGGVAPAQPAPQQMAQASPGPGADPFGFSRMPPQVAAAVKSMLSNPLPAAQARAQSIIERYVKTEQWNQFTDPNTGASMQRNSNTGEQKLIQAAPNKWQWQKLENGDIFAQDTTTGKPEIIRAGEQDALLRQYEAAKRDPNNPFKGSVFDFKKQLAEAGANKTNVNTTPGPAAAVYKTFEERYDQAKTAANALPSFAEAKRLLDSGEIILGAGADNRVALTKLGGLLGMDTTAAANAETFGSVVAPQVLALVRGLGAGSGISNADREFAQKAAGGSINLEPSAIKRLMDIGERAARMRVKEHNTTLDRVYPESDPQNGQVRSLFRVEVPENMPAPEPVKPKPRLGSVPIPPAAANALKADPKLREQFDAKYGEGAAKRVLGN